MKRNNAMIFDVFLTGRRAMLGREKLNVPEADFHGEK